jgi:2-methylcitrate dehydratase PrpD
MILVMSEATITGAFVDKLLGIRYRSTPPEAIEIAKQIVLDGLAVMHAGSTEPLGVGRIVTAYVREAGGHPQASVVAGGFKTSMVNAAFANGTMAHALDFDNTSYPPNHPTSPTLPVILAIAEHHRLPGEKIIEAVVAAFEAQARVRIAASGLATGSGFHKPGTVGLFGAVTAAARLLDLTREQTLMAFGIAGSRASSLSINTGTMTKSSHSGHGARMGLESAVLAKMGWTASADVFGPKGFFDTFMPGNARPELLTEGFAAPLWMLDPGVGFKAFPSNGFTQRPIDGALELRREHGIKPEQIDRVQVVFPRFEYVNRPQPRSGLDGKFSIQYTTLLALLDGEVTVDSFTDERLRAADVKMLLPKVELTFDDTIPFDKVKMHVIINVWLRDGRQLSKRVDKLLGWPNKGKPLTREQRHHKFFSCTRRVLAEKAARRMLELVERVETLPNVVEIMDIARCEKAPA